MKSQNRAWILFVLVFLAWNSLFGSPFRYFANMIEEGAQWIFSQTAMTPAIEALILYSLYGTLLTSLLLIGRSKNQIYIAGICSLATLVHHLVLCIQTGKIYSVSPAIAIGLALALLFLIIKTKRPALWLSDAYVTALAVWIIRDGVLSPIVSRTTFIDGSLGDFLALPSKPWIESLEQVWSLPVLVWAVWPLLMGIGPLVLLARGRKKG